MVRAFHVRPFDALATGTSTPADGMTPYDAFTSESAYRNRRESLDDPPTGTYSLQALT
jgi:hypothetical protein